MEDVLEERPLGGGLVLEPLFCEVEFAEGGEGEKVVRVVLREEIVCYCPRLRRLVAMNCGILMMGNG